MRPGFVPAKTHFSSFPGIRRSDERAPRLDRGGASASWHISAVVGLRRLFGFLSLGLDRVVGFLGFGLCGIPGFGGGVRNLFARFLSAILDFFAGVPRRVADFLARRLQTV